MFWPPQNIFQNNSILATSLHVVVPTWNHKCCLDETSDYPQFDCFHCEIVSENYSYFLVEIFSLVDGL